MNAATETPNVVYRKTVPGGAMWSQVLSRGKTLRLTDINGGANVGALIYNADQPLERYNMPDTLKGQHIFFLTAPYCLHSDMGRILCSITEDTCGWHDTVCGCSDSQLVADKYGIKTYQDARNDFHRNARDNFLIELAKWGLGKRDLVPNLNFFSKVVADEKGELRYLEGHSKPGDYIELRVEVNALIVLNTCQHPLDPKPAYSPQPVEIEVFPSPLPGSDDPSRCSRSENKRAFINTENYNALRD